MNNTNQPSSNTTSPNSLKGNELGTEAAAKALQLYYETYRELRALVQHKRISIGYGVYEEYMSPEPEQKSWEEIEHDIEQQFRKPRTKDNWEQRRRVMLHGKKRRDLIQRKPKGR